MPTLKKRRMRNLSSLGSRCLLCCSNLGMITLNRMAVIRVAAVRNLRLVRRW